jgi:hypothetical protein
VLAIAGGSSSPGSSAKDEYCPQDQQGQNQGNNNADCGGQHPGGPPEKPPPCVDRRRFSFRLHHGPRSRIVEVRVYVDGKLKFRRRGHDLRGVVLRRLPHRTFHVRIVTIHSNGSRLVSTRRYRGCKKGHPHTTGHHHG